MPSVIASFPAGKIRNEKLLLLFIPSPNDISLGEPVADKKEQLMSLLKKIKGDGKSIVGYGASGRANTIIQYCGITNEYVDYMVDDAPAKQGLYTPGSHLLIRNNEYLKKQNPDYVLLFAWAFYKEIAAKLEDYISAGGKLIVPLPEVKIYPKED